MIFSRGQVLLCKNGTWRKITGINSWKNEVYYTTNAAKEASVHTTKNMSMQFWCTYHDVHKVDSVHTAVLYSQLPKLTENAHNKGLHFAEKQMILALAKH
ncbi:hypothetical protein [Psychromonas antarctica]|jgi:hypothetical protein|uniref:hypothetical protein n=1 Tax=Psychromonas antarctica TaxID=67573 RepID=UPI001EE98C7F|nr:hypothetical protein [Psychromonas antarctica]MCG6201040.1 hypothetical protein [Psychromonas antarctica]